MNARMRTVTTSLPFEAHLSGLTVVQHLPSFTLGAETPSNRRSALAYQGARPDERGSERHWQESKGTDGWASQSDSSSSPLFRCRNLAAAQDRFQVQTFVGHRWGGDTGVAPNLFGIQHVKLDSSVAYGVIDDARNYLGLEVLGNRRLAKTVAEVRRR